MLTRGVHTRSALTHDGDGVHTYYEPVCLDGIPLLNDDGVRQVCCCWAAAAAAAGQGASTPAPVVVQVHIRFKVSMNMHASPEAVAVSVPIDDRRRTSSLLEAASGRKPSTPAALRK